ncbi:hypothetical protein [Lyngbya sp. CCY1209]|uniref:hypothetical protein n=1 Tax=Lyngbya sp. CCY1209 TaxID=2886103 RepID=UPI002D1FEF9E|nr:hypothetical protein [Lyngbya sp. CCY1209]MEB3882098.1 hypothetical protein [Lyngbya sp. CCY1209]
MMKNVVKLTRKDPWERQLLENFDLSDRLGDHSLESLDGICADFQHMSWVVKSIQKDYQTILEQNKRLKALLIGLVEGCYCWEGNRCQSCQTILSTLIRENTDRPDSNQTSPEKSLGKIRRFLEPSDG